MSSLLQLRLNCLWTINRLIPDRNPANSSSLTELKLERIDNLRGTFPVELSAQVLKAICEVYSDVPVIKCTDTARLKTSPGIGHDVNVGHRITIYHRCLVYFQVHDYPPVK
jgi:hypothetical protein